MSRQFKIMDDSGDKRLDFDEFAKAIRDFRVDLDPSMVQSLFNYFDADRSGLVDYEEFVHKLRGEMNEYRISLVR